LIKSAVCCITLTFSLVVGFESTTRAQAIDAGAVFRVFLKNGQALPSYGESAIVGDRIVFTLLVGAADARPTVQLMSLPADRVDLARTRRYADAMRARHYAATRGEVDYAAMTQEVQRTLAQLTSVQEPKKRLELAEQARTRLLSWATGTYGYRAREVRELTGLFDDVIAELRAAAGERKFAVELRSGPAELPPEPILGLPTLAESIALALEAARAADGDAERVAILRAAQALAATSDVSGELAAALRRELDTEANVAVAYTTLFSSVRARAEDARRRADVRGVEEAIAALKAGDRDLGARRPQTVDALLGELGSLLESTRTHRAALDRYAKVRGSLLQYERTVRPVMSGLDGAAPVLNAMRDMKYTAYERLERLTGRLAALRTALQTIAAPDDLADVHATLDSALKMASYAVARRRLAMSIMSEIIDREASSAAAGALMLSGRAREQLVARLYPPKTK
jgi:hypothetical protein